MKIGIKWLNVLLVTLTIFIFNPSWPIWGSKLQILNDEGLTLEITSSSLDSFLQNSHYSSLNHISAVVGLICLYLSFILLISSLVIHYIKRKNIFSLNLITSILLIIVGIILPISCNYSMFPFTLYCLIPLICGILLLFKTLYFDIKEIKNK